MRSDDPGSLVMHHVGLVVRDLGRSVAFYETVLGAQAVSSSVVAENREQAVPAYSRVMLAVLGGRIELLEYDGADHVSPTARQTWDVGTTHLGFSVRDADATAQELARRGLRSVERPLRRERDGNPGPRIVFGADPDGNRIEFLQLA